MKRKFILQKLTAAMVTCTMLMTTCLSANAASTSNEVSSRETKNAELSMEAATEGMVLLENKNKALPIASEGNIALFGQGAYNTVKGGTGSGDVNQRYTVSVKDALEKAGYNITSSDWLESSEALYDEGLAEYNKETHSWWDSYSFTDNSEITDDDVEKASAAKTAIYVISRNSGEGLDRTDEKGDYYLTDIEYDNIKKMAESFENSIVLLNVGGVIDTKFVDKIPELDSVLLMSQGGMEGGTAAVKVLNGEVNPSGKLTDTWAENYSDYPSSETFSANDNDVDQEDYTDDIYVGYRYFDTFNITPAYEFGYGLSYTTFDMNVVSVEADDKEVTVKVKVKNTGKYSGKEVAEVYFSAPDGNLEKPYQELAGYGKTDLLAPGKSQILTISYNTSEMSSYSEEKAAYLMEKGDYIIRVGNSSRNTQVGATLKLDSTVTTEQLSNQMKVDKNITTLSNSGATPYSYEKEVNEISDAETISLSSKSLDLIDGDNASEYDDENVTTYVSNSDEKDDTTTSSSEENDTTTNDTTTDDNEEDQTTTKSKYAETKENVEVKENATLYDVYNKDITMEQFVTGLSVDKLANIVEGLGWSGSTAAIIGAQANSVKGAAGETTGNYYESDGIPNIVLADGPAGIRITQSYEDNDETYYQYCTAWPIGSLLAQTWNPEVVEGVGKAIGEEMTEYGVTLWLAPGMNIHRNPLCRRNFEYYSEDPFLTGTMGAAATKGVQSNPGIGVTIKHYAGNNQEENRTSVNDTISERALREIYLKGFEIAVKSAQPMAIMTSYNLINSVPSGDNYDLDTDLARGEWGFNGLIMTDWGGGQSTPSISMHAGNDLIMPGGSQEDIIKAVIDYAPVFDEDGYIATETGSSEEQWNDFTVTTGGAVTVSTKVSAGTALNSKVSQMVDEGKASVALDTDDTEETIVSTINDVAAEIDLSTTTEAAVSENTEATTSDTTEETISDSTDETTSTTTDAAVEVDSDVMTDTSHDRIVTYYGSYADNNTLLLGDLQKSAMNVLNTIMKSTQFANMNADKGVKAESYTESFDDLKNYLTLTTSAISNSSSHSGGGNSSSKDSSSDNATSNDTTVEVGSKWSENTDGTWSFINENGEKATGWIQSEDAWYYLNSSGIMQTGWIKDTNGLWYYLNDNGTMKTGWLKDTNGQWYYLNDNGSMKTGWFKDTNGKWYYFNDNGSMKLGWFKDTDGKWYYFNNSGDMAVNTTIDGYEVDSTGACIS